MDPWLIQKEKKIVFQNMDEMLSFSYSIASWSAILKKQLVVIFENWQILVNFHANTFHTFVVLPILLEMVPLWVMLRAETVQEHTFTSHSCPKQTICSTLVKKLSCLPAGWNHYKLRHHRFAALVPLWVIVEGTAMNQQWRADKQRRRRRERPHKVENIWAQLKRFKYMVSVEGDQISGQVSWRQVISMTVKTSLRSWHQEAKEEKLSLV